MEVTKRGRLHEHGWITRNQCLSQFPAISRFGSRIADLKREGYKFKPEWKGGDYCYTLLSINGVPYANPVDRARMLKEAAENVRFFENYQSERACV
jgi:hypothetical protein